MVACINGYQHRHCIAMHCASPQILWHLHECNKLRKVAKQAGMLTDLEDQNLQLHFFSNNILGLDILGLDILGHFHGNPSVQELKR